VPPAHRRPIATLKPTVAENPTPERRPVDRLMLLDSNGLIYRAYFALPPLTTSHGELVNAVFGFCSIVLRAIADVRPEYVVAAFDLPAPTFRHEQYAAYKATRLEMPDDLRDQLPKVRRVVEALNIPIYELPGYEADDVIGTLTREAEAQGLDSWIVTGDLDMLQLVTERTRLVTTRSGVENTVVYDPAKVAERYGLRPDQMVDFKALKGDPTDNIPGVPGVGEKTAARLIAQFGSLDALYEHLDEVTPERLRAPIAEAKEQVLASRELMRIVRDLPIHLDLERARLGRYDREAVIRLFREFEFRSLLDRLPPLAGEGEEEARAALRATAEAAFPAARVGARPAGWGPERQRTTEPAAITPGEGGVVERPRATDRSTSAATAGRSLLDEGVGLQLSLDFDAVASRPAAAAGAGEGAPGEPDGRAGVPAAATPSGVVVTPSAAPAPAPADLRARLAAAVADPSQVLEPAPTGDALAAWLAAQPAVGVAYVQTDPRPLRGEPLALGFAGVDGRVLVATEAATRAVLRLLTEIRPALVGHEVKPLLVAALVEAPEAPALPVAFDTQIAAYLLNASLRSQPLADVVAERLDVVLPPAGDLAPPARAGLDALAALAVRPVLEAALEGEGLARLFREVELPLIPILARMERIGVAVDRAALAALDAEFAAEIRRLEAEIYDAVGHEFNLGSPKQLEHVLFFELNLPKGRRTKTGYSTDASVLEELRPAHPMIDKLLEWRMYTKLRSTYVQALPALIAADGRLHTTFHQAVAATGRLSSSDPNLQNIPIRTPLGRRIRRAFVAGDPAWTLLAADYSQIELRILAHVSGDEHLREAFARGVDVHRETAARVLRKDPAAVTPDERSMAKMVNFGIAYGMSDFGLSTRAGISRAEAQEFINNYFATYSGISYYMLHIKEVARRDGVVTTLLGRKRSIPELAARNPSLRAAGERMAINMPIQGTAADIMKIAMIRVDERLRAAGSRARMLLQVHDELVFEVPREEVETVAGLVRETMETAVRLDVPLVVEVKVGDDWEGMTPLGREAGEVGPDEGLADVGAVGADLGEPVG